MDSRCRILDAAARIYAEFGFRGATTRRIAREAGVNEVTLFRAFGSKEALIEEAMRHHAATQSRSRHVLPEVPEDPARELTAFAALQLEELREHRSLIRKTMGELEERPDLAPTVTAGWAECDAVLHRYLGRLRDAGWVGDLSADDLLAAGAMFMGALFSDAMGRDMLPALFPQPAERAPGVYTRLFLRAVACRDAAAVEAAVDAADDAPAAARTADHPHIVTAS